MVFNLFCKPASKNWRDYPHPIASYGTQMPEALSVICLSGKHTPEELTRIVTNMNRGRGSIVLLDSYYSLAERQRLAMLLKDTSTLNSFLLIDQVLLLYLATLRSQSRQPALLKCGLPYSFVQPFTNGSSATIINEEMFFGRKTELNEILSYSGASIVYGGRQLGKTALLHRAKSLVHDPANKKYALYVDVNGLGIDGTLEKLSAELSGIGFSKGNYESFSALFSNLSKHFGKPNQKKEIKEFLLLIDEADTFFEEAALDGYRIIQPFHEMQMNHSGHFKFVFAGLHNVARLKEARKDNSIIPHLGEPLCIKPMLASDARNLLMRPLSYLGFTDPDNELEKILPRTNYYPGILQYFGYTLVDEIAAQYRRYYNQNDNPPFPLDANLMKKIIGLQAIDSEIRKKLRITIELHEVYELLANIITFLYYEDIDEKLELVYSMDKIIEFIEDYQIQVLIDMGKEEIASYLDEMVEMGVLWGTVDTPRGYRLLRESFARTIGTKNDVDNYIQEYCG
jgi:Cdc6-like AAA superfamily ATPase